MMLKKYAPILLFALLFLVLSVRLKSLDDPQLLEFDTVYFHRVAEQIATTGRFEPVETIRYYPYEWDSKFLKPLPPYAVAALCKISPFSAGCDPKYASKWYAPFFAVLMVVVMAYIGYRASGDFLISAALLAFLPGILFRSASGFTDKDTAALFLMLFSLYFAYRTLQEKTAAGALIQGVFGGIAMGLAAISMSSYILYLFPLAIFAFVQVLRKRTGNLPGFVPFLSLPFLILLTLDYKNGGFNVITDLHSMMVIGAAFLVAVSYFLFNSNRFSHLTESRKLGYSLAVVLVIGLVALYGTGRNIPALVEDVAASLGNPIRGSTHSSSVGEQQPTNWAWPWEPGWQGRNSFWDQTRYLFFIAPLIAVVAYINGRNENGFEVLLSILFPFGIILTSLIFVKALSFLTTLFTSNFGSILIASLLSMAFVVGTVYITKRNEDERKTVLLIYGASFALMIFVEAVSSAGVLASIFPMFLPIFVILLLSKRDEDILTACLFFFNMFAASKAIRLMVSFAPLAALAGGQVMSFVLQKSEKNNNNNNNNKVLQVLAILAIAFVVFDLYKLTSEQSNSIHTSVNSEWYEDFKWINLNTKQNAPVVTWWDYGYWIQYFARRPSVADGENTGPGGSMNIYLGQFFTERNETRAINWLTGVCAMDTCARLITFDATMIGKMYWASAISWDARNRDWTPKMVGNSISYSTFSYMDTRETPYGPARIYAAPGGEVFLARVEANNTIIPLIIYPASGGQATVSDIITPYGVFKAAPQAGLQVIPGGVYFAGNMAIFMPPEAEDNIFTTTFIMDAIPPRCVGFELKNEPGGKFCEVFNNGFTKTFMV